MSLAVQQVSQCHARRKRSRAKAAQEREANVTVAYEARTAALRTLLGGRLARPEVTRLLANFLVRLAFRDGLMQGSLATAPELREAA